MLKHIITIKGRYGSEIAFYNDYIIIDEKIYVAKKYDKHLAFKPKNIEDDDIEWMRFTMHKKNKYDKSDYIKEQYKIHYKDIVKLDIVDYPLEKYMIIYFKIPEYSNETFSFTTSILKKQELSTMIKQLNSVSKYEEEFLDYPNVQIIKDVEWYFSVIGIIYATILIAISFILKYSENTLFLIPFYLLWAICFIPFAIKFYKTIYTLYKKKCRTILVLQK